jgi:hypothetical protein
MNPEERRHQKAIQPDHPFEMEGATGASDSNSGGGAGAGIPDADVGMNVGDEIDRGNPDQDRKKLFPELHEERVQKPN